MWEVSRQGLRLAHATAARPIQRATAERLLAGVLDRAAVLRDFARHEYALGVGRLIVFGSYLGDGPTLNDLDVSVAWTRRHPEDRDRQLECVRARIRLARRAGRQFSNISSEYMWPELEAARDLRGGSRAVSLHSYDEEADFIAGIPHRVLI